MRAGLHDEDAIRAAFAALIGRGAVVNSHVGTFVCESDNFLATPDGIVTDLATGRNALLEIKRPLNDVYPAPRPGHIVQMLCQMRASGLRTCWYVVCHPWGGMRVWFIEYDDWAWQLVEAALAEYRRLDAAGDMPARQSDCKATAARLGTLVPACLVVDWKNDTGAPLFV